MKDKVQKIREEVERLKSNLIHGACASQIAMETRCKEEAYDEVISLLDSLQEEPVSIWHDASEKPEREDLLIETNDGRIIHRQSINNYGMVKRWAYTSDLLNLDNSCNFGKNLKEPVSEDLEKAINFYIENNFFGSETLGFFSNRTKKEPNDQDIALAFKAGAQWQKEQMVKNVVLETKVYLESDGDGIESEHQEWLALENNEILDIPNNIGLKDGDKVKVIIIKEEESV